MTSAFKDARRAIRQWRRSPGFALAVVATLAVGFGSVAAIFTIVHAVLIRPLPYPDSDRLVALHHTAPGWNVAKAGMSDGTYDYYRRRAHAFEEIGLYNENAVNLTDGDLSERVPVALGTPSVFRILGVAPALGRLFTEEDLHATRAVGAVVISHDLWIRRYGGDPHIVGRLIRANKLALEVIGVLPAGFAFPSRETAIWYLDGHDGARPSVRDFYLGGLARLKPGVTPRAAQSELQGLLRAMIGAYPDATPDIIQQGRVDPIVLTLKDDLIGPIKLPLIVLLCAMALVLAIAWANVANLWLVRGEARRQELAVQRALGATTMDLVRAALCESVLLTVPAAALGLLLARAGVTAIVGRTAQLMPRVHEIQMDATVWLLVALLTGTTAVALALVSLAQAGRRHLTGALRSGTRQQTMNPAQRVAQRGLVALQVALALVVLIGSAAMLQSLWRMRAVTLGFAPESRLTFALSLPYDPSYNAYVAFDERLIRDLRALPGVSDAGIASSVPLQPGPLDIADPIQLAADAVPGDPHAVRASVNIVTPGYLDMMKIPLVAGRRFDPAAQLRDELPVIISQSLARALAPAPGESLIGRLLYGPGSGRGGKYSPYRVIGVARDVIGASITGGPSLSLYVPVLPAAAGAPLKPRYYPGDGTVVIHTTTPPETLVPLVRDIVRTLNPRLAIANVRTLQSIVDASTASTALIAALLTIGASAGLLLALIGVFGVTMHLVATRRKEMAVRFALGARPVEVRRLVLRSVAATLCAGAVLGIGGGLLLTRALGALLFNVSARDPLTFLVAPAIVVCVGLLAGDVPARRAARIDPARALAND